MLLLEPSVQNQLTVLLILAIVLFIAASALPQKVATVFLLLLAPFQTVETRFGSSTVVLAYVVFIAMILRKETVRLPHLPMFLFLLLWYLVTMSLTPQSAYVQHAVYIFALISAMLVFWLGYDLAGRLENPKGIVNAFVATNILIAVYCAIQLWVGPGERMYFFGVPEINMTRVRADGRLTGPFESAEISAQYFVLMQFLLLHQFWYTQSKIWKRVLIGLAAINMVYLVATGSRGEFLLLVGGACVYLWLFRQRLGVARSIKLAIGGATTFAVTALIVVNFTQFDGLFDRLQDTEFNEQGIPDTRQYVWPPVWNAIKEKPLTGHGPRFRFFNEHRGVRYEDKELLDFPHNLYLYLAYTIGIPGMLLYIALLVAIGRRCWIASSLSRADPYWADLARTGVLVILLFLIDGMKIEQTRLVLADYWHVFFAMCGVFVAASSLSRQSAEESPAPVREISGSVAKQGQILSQ